MSEVLKEKKSMSTLRIPGDKKKDIRDYPIARLVLNSDSTWEKVHSEIKKLPPSGYKLAIHIAKDLPIPLVKNVFSSVQHLGPYLSVAIHSSIAIDRAEKFAEEIPKKALLIIEGDDTFARAKQLVKALGPQRSVGVTAPFNKNMHEMWTLCTHMDPQQMLITENLDSKVGEHIERKISEANSSSNSQSGGNNDRVLSTRARLQKTLADKKKQTKVAQAEVQKNSDAKNKVRAPSPETVKPEAFSVAKAADKIGLFNGASSQAVESTLKAPQQPADKKTNKKKKKKKKGGVASKTSLVRT